MNNRVYYLLVVFACMAALTSCDNPNNQDFNNPLVGQWEEAVNPSNQNDSIYSRNCYPEGPDAGFGGTWLFEKDGSYQMEFWVGTIAGSKDGYSSGSYDLISDSILVLHVTHYEFADSVYPADPGVADTHYVAITDTLFTDTLFTERPGGLSCLVFWRRVK